MNRKGQMSMGNQSNSGAHPVLIIGIFVFVIPLLSNFIHINIPNWISGFGLVLILIGAGLSIFKNA